MDIISRKAAKENGFKHYFTGKPCSEGGIGLRLVSNGRCYCYLCIAKIKTQKSNDYVNHKDKRDSTTKNWKNNNRSKSNFYAKKSKEKFKKDKPILLKTKLEGTYYSRNKQTILAKRKEPLNKERILSDKRKYKKLNKDKVRAESSTRRARRKLAVPVWFNELDSFVLEEAASLCVIREKETHFEWHIDHMYPLANKDICGLHCAENIQVIPAFLNLKKNNSLMYIDRYDFLKDC